MAAPAKIIEDIEADNDDETAPVDDAFLTAALTEFDELQAAESEEREAALEDRRFVTVTGAQWDGAWGDQFENSFKVEIDKTTQGVQRIKDQYRANRMIVNFRAVGKDASEDTAETLNGMFRADFYRSHGQQVFDNAFEEAVEGGYGALRLTNEYCDEYDPDDDTQHICLISVPEADQSVYFVGGKLYDKSDARRCYVVSALTVGEFETEYPDASAVTWPDSNTRQSFDWFAPNLIRVAEVYDVEEVKAVCRYFTHVATGEERKEFDLTGAESAAIEREGWKLDKVRKVKRRRVAKTVMSGAEILVPKRYIAGCEIPVVPVYGHRRIVEGVERVRGHVRKAKDAQRVYNAEVASLVETSATAPQERPIFTPEQVAGHEQSWAEANINRAPYALINPMTGADGSPMPVGPVAKVEAPQVQPATAALIQIAGADINEMTASDDAAAQVKSNVSAEAMDIAATRIDDKAFTYLDNMRQSVHRVGQVWLSMARDVYVEEGREVETMDADGKAPGTAVLAEPYTDERGRFSIRNDISRGKYKVVSDVTEATTTRRDKTVKTLIAGSQMVAGYDPELAAAMMGTALLNMDGEGMDDLQDWQRQRLVVQGVVKPTDEERQQMEEAAANAQPDPQEEALRASAAAMQAAAEKDLALAGKAEADTDLSKAKTVEALASAKAKASGAEEQKRAGFFGRMTSMFGGGPSRSK